VRSSLRPLLLGIACTGILTSACAADAAIPQPRLPEVAACFVTDDGAVPVTLEVAREFSQRQAGLMGRESLLEDEGMLFQYPDLQSSDRGFWMYKTLLDLDIAYLDERGRIASIRQMAPCVTSSAGSCPSYPAGVAFQSAVEMNQDFFSNHGIEVGDQLMTGKEHCSRP
jgi:uncharacterized protein